jgi:effector-binding domain-containing protein
MAVLFQTRQATLGELGSFAGTVVKELYKYVADLDLLVCGPQYWFYYGVDGRPETRFTLEIAIPVLGQIPTALLPYFKQIPYFKCLSHRYEGPWEGLSGEYAKMVEYINWNGLNMNGIYAEAFLNVDFTTPGNNITEIQIGLS